MPGKKDFSNRKELRLKKYDYSSTGAYFVTICVKDRMPILSHILKPVGGGALDAPQVQLTEIGRIIEKNLLSSENISGVKIDRYVIMPDHIRALFFLIPISTYNEKMGRRRRRPLPCSAAACYFRHLNGFVIKKSGEAFLSAAIMSILYVTEQITRRESNICMKTRFIGVIMKRKR